MGFSFGNITPAMGSFRDNIGNFIESLSTRSSNALSRTSKIYKSALGQAAYLSLRENVSEALAYYAGGDLGGRVAKIAGSAIDQELKDRDISTNSTAYFLFSCLMSKFIVDSIFSSLGNNWKVNILKMSTIITFALILNTVFSVLSQVGATTRISNIENLFEESFNLVGYISLGLIAAYKAIKLCGSQEEFNNSNKGLDTYPIKSLFSMGACAIMESSGLTPAAPILNQVANLAYGSFFYNIKDLQNVGKSVINGALLDKSLPAELKIVDELALNKKIINSMISVSAEKTIDVTIKTISHQTGIKEKTSIFMDQILSKTFSTIFGKSNIDTGKLTYKLSSKITSIASKAANNLLKKSGKEEKLAELLSANTVAKKSLDLTVSVFLNTFVHTTNSYIEYLNSQNSQIRSLMESTSSYLEKYEELSSQLDNKLSEAPLLNFFIEEHLSSLLKVKDNFDLVLFPLLDKDMIKLISQTAVEIVEQQEENFVGVSILTDEGKDGLKKEIQSHLKTISRLLPIFFLKAKLTKPDENEMKTFYKNLNGLSQAYTKQLVGEKASSFFKDFIDYQLQNSKLL